MPTTPFRPRLSTGGAGRQTKQRSRKLVSRQTGTVGHFQEQLNHLLATVPPHELSDAVGALQTDLKRQIRRVLPANFHYFHMRLEQAPPARRSEVPKNARISYSLHNPPGSWGDLRHAILRCQVFCKEAEAYENGFISHVGEELLYTSQPGLHYGFFQPKNPKVDRPEPIPPEQLFRIRSQFPHHNYQKPTGRSTEAPIAWMILRSASHTGRTSADALGPDENDVGALKRPRQSDGEDDSATFIARDELIDPSHYAMRAWGLAENIRRHRQRAGLTINQLASKAGMNASYLSRLERGVANIGLDSLRLLADFLGLDLTRIPNLLKEGPVVGTETPVESHWLHDYRHSLETHEQLVVEPLRYAVATVKKEKGRRRDEDEELARTANGESSSWIVVSGEVVFQLDLPNEKPLKEIVSADGVLHLKPLVDGSRATFQAREPSTLLEIRHSACCTCKRQLHASVTI